MNTLADDYLVKISSHLVGLNLISSFAVQKVFNFLKFHLLILVPISQESVFSFRKFLPMFVAWNIFFVLSSSSSKVYGFHIKDFMIQFKLTFVQVERYAYPVSRTIWWSDFLFSPVNILGIFVKNQVAVAVWVYFSILLYWTVCLFSATL